MTLTAIGLKDSGLFDIEFLHVFPLDEPNDFYLASLKNSNIKIRQLDQFFLNHTDSIEYKNLRKINAYESLVIELMPYIREFINSRPEIVHIWQDQMNIRAGLAALIVGIPKIILSCRSLAPDNFGGNNLYMRPIYKFLIGHPNVTILNNSNAGAEDYKRWLRKANLKIKVIYNGLDFNNLPLMESRNSLKEFCRNEAGIDSHALVLGGIMRFTEEKQPEFWIRIAFEISLLRPNICFVLVGDGPMLNDIKILANKLGLQNIYFSGYKKNVYDWIISMDLLMLTSRAEGLPNVLMESQALGTPVISTIAGGAAEVVDIGRSGILLQSSDPRICAMDIIDILTNDDWMSSAKSYAHSFIGENFSAVKMIDEHISLYK